MSGLKHINNVVYSHTKLWKVQNGGYCSKPYVMVTSQCMWDMAEQEAIEVTRSFGTLKAEACRISQTCALKQPCLNTHQVLGWPRIAILLYCSHFFDAAIHSHRHSV